MDAFDCHSDSFKRRKVVRQYEIFQTSFTASKSSDNPITGTEANVIFENGREQWIVPAYWSGGNRWTVRFSPPSEGIYNYHIESTKNHTSRKGCALSGLFI